jgi:hypothetical protein
VQPILCEPGEITLHFTLAMTVPTHRPGEHRIAFDPNRVLKLKALDI